MLGFENTSYMFNHHTLTIEIQLGHIHLQDPKDTPPPTRAETRDERRERKRREKAEQVAYKLEQEIAMCKLCQEAKFNTNFKILTELFLV